jgi:cbb3-type cytochrome oxidase subunit 3
VLAASYADVGGGFVAATVVLTAFVLAVGALALRPQARAARARVARDPGTPPASWPYSATSWRRLQRARVASLGIGASLVVGAWCLVLSDVFESHALLVAGGLVFALLAAFLLLFCALALLGRPRALVPRDLR